MNSYWGAHASAQKIAETTKPMKICCNTNRIYFKIVRRRTEVMYQQRVNRSESRVTERTVGDSRQNPPLAFVLKEDILSTCCNKSNVT